MITTELSPRALWQAVALAVVSGLGSDAKRLDSSQESGFAANMADKVVARYVGHDFVDSPGVEDP